MISIFEQLDAILKSINENENPDEMVEVKLPPINPDMETADQGTDMALQKIAMYFYKLQMEGGGGGMKLDNSINLPDDFLDPILKGKLDNFKDKTFQKNKVVWDKEQLEKLKKEVEVNVSGDSDDDFDDFDYRDNDFGDDDADTSDLENNSDGGSGGSSSQSEQDRLQDAINDAIDKLRSDRGMDNQDSGSQNGGQQGGQQQNGNQQNGGQQGGQQQNGGQQNGGQQSGSSQNGNQGGGKSITSSNGSGTERDKMLSDLKDAIERGDSKGAEGLSEKIKEGDDGSGKLAGESIGKVSDDALNDDMKKAGLSDKDIQEMGDMKDDDGLDGMNEDDIKDLKREIIKGLDKKCAKKGGSALAKTIVRTALKAKIDDSEWRQMLKLFLKSKSVKTGSMSEVENDVKYGHKNHLWRNAVLPTTTVGQGQIQNIYCFIDFSGSVNQDLVYTFLGKVIDLCSELNYTNVIVYGLGGERLTLPKEITARMLKTKGKNVVLSQTWDFIQQQNPGAGGTNFAFATPEILEIRKKQRDAVYLVFGDAYWSEYETLPLRDDLGERLCDRICMLLYYKENEINAFAPCVAILKELVGLKNIITTKASSIKPGVDI